MIPAKRGPRRGPRRSPFSWEARPGGRFVPWAGFEPAPTLGFRGPAVQMAGGRKKRVLRWAVREPPLHTGSRDRTPWLDDRVAALFDATEVDKRDATARSPGQTRHRHNPV